MKHKVEEIKLSNGARGLLIDVPEASVMNITMNFRAGDYLSPVGKCDTAHIMEHMVLGANKRFKKSSDFSKEFSKNGAYDNASTGLYHLNYYAECADFEADRILDLLCLAIEAPLFLPSEFKAEVANVREELKGMCNYHFNTLSMLVGEAMGQSDVSYSKRVRQLNKINLKDIKDHYAKTHQSHNLRFLIAGNIKNRKEKIIKRLNKLSLLSTGDRIELPDEKLFIAKKPIVKQDVSVKNIYYRFDRSFGGILPQRDNDAANALLGATLATLHSRIFGKAREKGLVYGINYGRYRTKDEMLWWAGGQVMPKNIEKLFKLFASELVSIAEGNFDAKELQETKQFALGLFQKGYQTVGQLLDAYYDKYVYEDKIEDYFGTPDRINAINGKDIKNAAVSFLSADVPWAMGFYGATKQIDANYLYNIFKKSLK